MHGRWWCDNSNVPFNSEWDLASRSNVLQCDSTSSPPVVRLLETSVLETIEMVRQDCMEVVEMFRG